MIVVPNPLRKKEHEAFAHIVAKGIDPTIAYRAVGYERDDIAAIALSQTKQIADRIKTLVVLYDPVDDRGRKIYNPEGV